MLVCVLVSKENGRLVNLDKYIGLIFCVCDTRIYDTSVWSSEYKDKILRKIRVPLIPTFNGKSMTTSDNPITHVIFGSEMMIRHKNIVLTATRRI